MQILTRTNWAVLVFLTCFGFLTICSYAKAAICWDYGTRYAHCGPGCEAQETTSCGFGCISGECVSNGGSGECCGELYYSAVIYPDGEKCGECGEIRTHKSLQSSENVIRLGGSPSPWWGAPRGLIKLSENVSYRPPRQAFVLNQCAHAYGVLVLKDSPLVVGDL